MARSYCLTGNDGDPRQDEAIERLTRRAVDLDPGYAQAWALLAVGAIHPSPRRMGGPATAARPPWTAPWPSTPIWPRPARSRRGCCPIAGRHEEAAAEIAVALRLDPESYEVNYRAGDISYDQGRLEDAARHFEKAAALIETDISTRCMMLMSCYTALGDGENTRRVARIALEQGREGRRPGSQQRLRHGGGGRGPGGSGRDRTGQGLDEPRPADRSRQPA